MYPLTIAQLKDNVFKKFPRKSTDIQNIFDAQVGTWINELSREFPFYFLRSYPLNLSTNNDFDFPLDFAGETRIVHQWIAPGWLITNSGQGQYRLSHPVEFEQWESSSFWVDSFCDRIHFVKQFDKNGVFMADLPINSRDISMSRDYTQPGRPRHAYLTQTEAGAYLNIVPVPDDHYLFAVEFQVINPPIYMDNAFNKYNQFLNFSPRVVELYCLIQVADYFDEPNLSLKYERSLYGDPPKGLHTAIQMKTGLLGNLVLDSQKAISQSQKTLQFFQSAKEAVGQGGPGRGWTRPNRYGYWSAYPY